MNIGICNQWYPPFSCGVVAQYNENLAKSVSRSGHKVVVVSSLVNGGDKRDYCEGVHVYRIPMPQIPYRFSKLPVIGMQSRFLRNMLYGYSVCKYLRAIVEKYQIQLVEYAEINGEGFFHRRYLGRLPYVVRCHTPYFLLEQTYEPGEMPFSCRYVNWMERKTIREANGVTAPSMDLAARIEDWCDLPMGAVVPIPNGIDTEWFHPAPDYCEEDVLKILFVGRIERAKGVFVLAKAIPDVVGGNRDVSFIFAGGPRTQKGFEELKSYLRQRGALQYCEFTGVVTKKELCKLYQQCDIFVNPSTIYESFSYTNAEAMACGKPVVTSDMGGMPETVGDEVGGLVFPTSDARDLAKKLCRLIEDRDLRLRLGAQARDRSVRHHSTQSVIDKVFSHYEGLLR